MAPTHQRVQSLQKQKELRDERRNRERRASLVETREDGNDHQRGRHITQQLNDATRLSPS